MAFLGIKVPPSAAQLLSQIQVPGEPTDTSELHITMFYFEDFSLTDTIHSLETIYRITGQTHPFSVGTATVSHFPGWDDKNSKCAVIAKISSPELHRVREKLATALDKAKIAYSKTYKEYRPHITLSYSEEEPEDMDIEPISFMISEIRLWAGREMNDEMIVNFPLSYAKREKNGLLLKRVELFDKMAGHLLF